MTVTSASCHLLLVLRSPPPLPLPAPSSSSSSSSFVSLLKPFFLPSSHFALRKQLHFHSPILRKKTLVSSFLLSTPSRSFSYTPPLFSLLGTTSTSKSIEEEFEDEEEEEEEEEEEYDGETDITGDDEFETERENFEDTQVTVDSSSSPLVRKREERLKVELPSLSVKERKELGSYANSLGKKLKTQSVGKSGITPNLVTAFGDNLEANELLKIKVHGSCPGELEDVVKQLEEATGSVTVGQIGRTFILYRPSLSKMKVEEKKKQVRKLFLEKQRKHRSLINRSKEQEVPKSSRRGSSWKVRGSKS